MLACLRECRTIFSSPLRSNFNPLKSTEQKEEHGKSNRKYIQNKWTCETLGSYILRYSIDARFGAPK